MNVALKRTVRTKRLLLRSIEIGDKYNVQKGLSDPHTMDTYGVDCRNDSDLEQQMRWYLTINLKHGHCWAICSLDNSVFYGVCCVYQNTDRTSGKLAYWILREHWRQGIASEALNAAIEHVFKEHSYTHISADVLTRNIAGINLLKKIGFALVDGIPDLKTYKKINYGTDNKTH